jgi:hypothetical protein
MRRSTIPARQKVFRSPDQRGSQNTHFCPLAIDMPSRSVFRIDLAKTELCVIDIPASRTARKRGRRPDKEGKRLDLGCSRHNLGGELSGNQIFLFFSQ